MSKANANSLHVTTIQGQNEAIDTFERASINRSKVPSKEVVEKLFEKLLSIRAFPEKAKLSLRNQSTERKWDLLLTENESNSSFDLNKMSMASMSSISLPGNSKSSSPKVPETILKAKSDNLPPQSKSKIPPLHAKEHQQHRETPISEGSPGWFVWKLLNKDVDVKNLVRLEKNLAENRLFDKENITWVQNFLSIQGETALAVHLSSISKKVIKSDEEYNHEYLLVKCMKNALENQAYVSQVGHSDDTPISKSVIISSLMGALTSTRMSTRFLVTEVLVNLMKNRHKDLQENIVNHLRNLSLSKKKTSHFKAWLEVFGSSLRSASWGSKISDHSYLKNYITITLILINVIVHAAGPARKRIAIRKQFEESHLLSIFETIKQFEDARIHLELEKYENSAKSDEQERNIRQSKTLPALPNLDDEYESTSMSTSSHTASGEFNELKKFGFFGPQERSTQLNASYGIRKSPVKRDASVLEDQNSDDSTMAQKVFSKIAALETSSNSHGLIDKVLLLLDCLLEKTPNSYRESGDKELFSAVTLERLIDSLSTESIARSAIAETKSLKKELKRQKQLNETLSKNAELQDKAGLRAENESQSQEIKSLGCQISLLQRQIKQLEQDKAKAFRNRNVNHSFEDLNSRDETDDDSVADDRSVSSTHLQLERISVNETPKKHFRKGPPTPPLLYSRPNLSAQKVDYNASPKRTDNDRDASTATVETPTKKSNELSVDISLKPQTLSVPSSPPSPSFLESIGKKEKISSYSGTVIMPSAPPLPPFLSNLASATAKSTKEDTKINSSEKVAIAEAAVITTVAAVPPPPPPPPPLPPFALAQSNASTLSTTSNGSIGSTPAPVPPPPPPPPPIALLPPPKAEAVSTDNAIAKCDPHVSNESTDISIRPKVKLKQLHWNKINDIEKTFWNEFEDSSISEKLAAEGIFEEVEKIFAASQPSKKSPDSEKSRKPNTDSKAAKVSFLSRDLAQQFGINLHMFAGVSDEALVIKILRCSPEILENISVIEFFNNDALVEVSDSLAKNLLPYSSDPRTGKKPQKDPKELDRADRLYLELCFNLKHYWRARSKALLFTQSYQKEHLHLKEKLDLVDLGISCVKESGSFKSVLGIMKIMGNFMNEHTKQARGFKLDSLQRLKYMKDESNSMSFLHYMEKTIRQSFSEYGSFVDDLELLTEMQNVSIEQLEVDCKAMNKEVEIINNSLQHGKLSREKDLHPSDRIIQTITVPMQNATSRNALIQSRMKRTLSVFKSLMVYFGEDPNDAKAKDGFFQKIITFVTEFKKAHVENIQKEEEQRVYDARKKRIEDESANKTPTEETDEKNFVDSVEESSAVIDSLLEKLKSTSEEAKTKRENRRSKMLTVASEMEVSSSELDSVTVENEYESVNNLKRRLTTRKSKLGLSTTNEQSVSRAQVMLHQLRTAEDLTLVIPNDDVNKENMVNIEKE
ncbi:hypothetical protein CANMA_002810 [Candida margitis]|uniref:uncharacterized protein n=1 Tax=Candida margitis TaxID=1775924 RepID=UPI00222654DA|nr:uncharacterized protein CANMA_002810 [Candida margitis]KAI5967630.1 hypothetical protein CANMA_002810 [Candida margitis]